MIVKQGMQPISNYFAMIPQSRHSQSTDGVSASTNIINSNEPQPTRNVPVPSRRRGRLSKTALFSAAHHTSTLVPILLENKFT